MRAHGAYAYDRCAAMMGPLLDEHVTLTNQAWPWVDEKFVGMTQQFLAPEINLYLDDDDVYVPYARYGREQPLDKSTKYIGGALCPFFIFRGIFQLHGILWREPEVRQSNVSTQLFAVTHCDLLGTWSERYEKDFDFLKSSVSNGMQPIFRPELLAIHNGATWDYRPQYGELVRSTAGGLPVAGPEAFDRAGLARLVSPRERPYPE